MKEINQSHFNMQVVDTVEHLNNKLLQFREETDISLRYYAEQINILNAKIAVLEEQVNVLEKAVDYFKSEFIKREPEVPALLRTY